MVPASLYHTQFFLMSSYLLELYLKEFSKAQVEGGDLLEGGLMFVLTRYLGAHRPRFILSLLFPGPFKEYKLGLEPTQEQSVATNSQRKTSSIST